MIYVKMECPDKNPRSIHAPNRTFPYASLHNPLPLLNSNGLRWHVQFLLVLVAMCHSSNSDFNVIIPEICGGTETPINVTWLRDMVQLGLRDEQLALSILGPEGKPFYENLFVSILCSEYILYEKNIAAYIWISVNFFAENTEKSFFWIRAHKWDSVTSAMLI